MNKIISTILISCGCVLSASAQHMAVVIDADTTFNAAEDHAKTSSGFDVNIKKLNVVSLGLQIVQDVAAANANSTDVLDALSTRSYYSQRADLMVSTALPERTNIYTNISFLNQNTVGSQASVIVTNLEIEHFFGNHNKFRVGRLANSVSESQFFGRMALEETSAHVYGRKLFINDAFEFDGNLLDKGGPVYFIGIKPQFKPLNLKGVYAGFHQPFKNGMQMHGIISVNRQFEDELRKYIPGYNGKQTYFSYEGEVAYKRPTKCLFLNIGGNLGYKGILPHTSGKFDFMNQLLPVVTDKGESFRETFTTSCGLHLFPSKISKAWKFMAETGLESEIQGALTDKFTSLNVCGYCKINITRRMVLTYYCTPQFIWQYFNAEKPSYIGGVVNFVRLSVTVGRPSRMFL
jgi:hypothetical protein